MPWKNKITPAILFAFVFCLFWGCSGDEKVTQTRFVEAIEDYTQISTDELNFGRVEEEFVVLLSNDNYEPARWSASTDASWMTMAPEQGRLDPWSAVSILVTVHRSGLNNPEVVGLVTIDIPTYGEKKKIWVRVKNNIPQQERTKNRYKL